MCRVLLFGTKKEARVDARTPLPSRRNCGDERRDDSPRDLDEHLDQRQLVPRLRARRRGHPLTLRRPADRSGDSLGLRGLLGVTRDLRDHPTGPRL